MLIRCKLVGTGADGDPRRCRFPIYNMISEDPATGTAIVDVPDRVAPDEIDLPNTPLRPLIAGRAVLIGLRVPQRILYAAKLARLYPRTLAQYSADDIA